MNLIKRNLYLDKLVARMNNGMVKVVTGLRRCGKSYLLDPIFISYLKEQNVPPDHIIKIELDKISNKKFHENPEALDIYIRSQVKDDKNYYLILDEIQLVKDFELILTGLLYEKNIDIYVTGSNSKFLSTDVITEFRGRGDQVHVYPLSFNEFYQTCDCDTNSALDKYMAYGGMPYCAGLTNKQDKAEYLKNLFKQTYFKDIIDRNNIKRVDVLDSIVDTLASSVGSLTNPKKIYDTLVSKGEKNISLNTVNSFLEYLIDSFVATKALRYDVKGRKYMNTPFKYYFTDVGFRNARLNFRQYEPSHLMENVIFNHLLVDGYNVDVGLVESRVDKKRVTREVDFVCNLVSSRVYIQSALNVDAAEKLAQECAALKSIKDNFQKIIVVRQCGDPWFTDDGIKIMGLEDFLIKGLEYFL